MSAALTSIVGNLLAPQDLFMVLCALPNFPAHQEIIGPRERRTRFRISSTSPSLDRDGDSGLAGRGADGYGQRHHPGRSGSWNRDIDLKHSRDLAGCFAEELEIRGGDAADTHGDWQGRWNNNGGDASVSSCGNRLSLASDIEGDRRSPGPRDFRRSWSNHRD
jgi:hypothetical protein